MTELNPSDLTQEQKNELDKRLDAHKNQEDTNTDAFAFLDELKSKNIKLAILSNKADELTKKIGNSLFPNYFEIVQGLKSELTKKPNPVAAIEISKNLGYSPEEVLYVGDSDIDMQTAKNANMFAVGVLWGYRPKEELIVAGAQAIIEHPLELLKLL